VNRPATVNTRRLPAMKQSRRVSPVPADHSCADSLTAGAVPAVQGDPGQGGLQIHAKVRVASETTAPRIASDGHPLSFAFTGRDRIDCADADDLP